MTLLDSLFRSRAVDDIFDDRTTVQRMLDFEAALARAEARTGVIPQAAAGPIVSKCHADLCDLEGLREAASRAGNLAIPLIKHLTAQVAAVDQRAAGFVHWGATSQDTIDTATMLQVRAALEVVESAVLRLWNIFCGLSTKYRVTPAVGRTWMQHGVPIVLGLKFAGWADALGRHSTRLAQAREQASVLQFGGAAGTLASLGDKGLTVAAALAQELNLSLPAMPWHAHRDRLAEVAAAVGILTGTLGKIGRDLSLLSQTEVGEVLERSGEGRGGSSTMPQKRNPVTAAVLLAAAARVPGLVSTMLTAMIQENERGVGGWQAEWETLPEIFRLTAGALHHLGNAAIDLEIREDALEDNLKATNGLIFAEAVTMALAGYVGKSKAHQVLEACARETLQTGEHLRLVLRKCDEVKQHLSAEEIDRLFEPSSYLGVAETFIDRVLNRERE